MSANRKNKIINLCYGTMSTRLFFCVRCFGNNLLFEYAFLNNSSSTSFLLSENVAFSSQSQIIKCRHKSGADFT